RLPPGPWLSWESVALAARRSPVRARLGPFGVSPTPVFAFRLPGERFPCISDKERYGVGNEVGARRRAELTLHEGRARRAAGHAVEEGRDLEAARRRQRGNQGRAVEEAVLAHEGRARPGRREPPDEGRDREGAAGT